MSSNCLILLSSRADTPIYNSGCNHTAGGRRHIQSQKCLRQLVFAHAISTILLLFKTDPDPSSLPVAVCTPRVQSFSNRSREKEVICVLLLRTL